MNWVKGGIRPCSFYSFYMSSLFSEVLAERLPGNQQRTEDRAHARGDREHRVWGFEGRWDGVPVHYFSNPTFGVGLTAIVQAAAQFDLEGSPLCRTVPPTCSACLTE
jgi:hypothetical protein